MYKIKPTTTNLLIDKSESKKLYKELENIFCKLDTNIPNNCFSGERIKERYPILYGLYCNLHIGDN